jgi:hypothetical protein
MSDFDLLEHVSSESDIIFQSVSIIVWNSILGLTKILQANADDLDATKAILKGLKKRFEHKKEPGTLIHTVSSRPLVRLLSSLSEKSGTGVLIKDTKGNSKTEKVYDDSKVEDIESLEDQQPHRLIDLEIVAADREGDVLWSSTTQISNLPLS